MQEIENEKIRQCIELLNSLTLDDMKFIEIEEIYKLNVRVFDLLNIKKSLEGKSRFGFVYNSKEILTIISKFPGNTVSKIVELAGVVKRSLADENIRFIIKKLELKGQIREINNCFYIVEEKNASKTTTPY